MRCVWAACSPSYSARIPLPSFFPAFRATLPFIPSLINHCGLIFVNSESVCTSRSSRLFLCTFSSFYSRRIFLVQAVATILYSHGSPHRQARPQYSECLPDADSSVFSLSNRPLSTRGSQFDAFFLVGRLFFFFAPPVTFPSSFFFFSRSPPRPLCKLCVWGGRVSGHGGFWPVLSPF